MAAASVQVFAAWMRKQTQDQPVLSLCDLPPGKDSAKISLLGTIRKNGDQE